MGLMGQMGHALRSATMTRSQAMPTLTISVPEAISEIARNQGRSVEDVARQALLEWTADALADAREAELAGRRWAEIVTGSVPTDDWEDVRTELVGLHDPTPPRR